jgi:hypothetical protein
MVRRALGPILVLLAAAATGQSTSGVDLSEQQHPSMRHALGQSTRTFDDWIDRFALSGFVATRAFDTGRGGTRPDGAIVIQAASLFVDVTVKDIGSVFAELRLDYFHEAGQNNVGLGEVYAKFDHVLGADSALGVKVGRFDLPFGEYYLLEDPDQNRMIGFPAVLPYRWDEGLAIFADSGVHGFVAALTDGTYSRDSQSGIGPGVTLRVHTRPCAGLYLSASGYYVDKADSGALCLGGSVITPVGGGAAGTSPSSEVRSTFGSLDATWQANDTLRLQAAIGGGRVDDRVNEFDRTLLWWMLEPSVQLGPSSHASLRWSGGGTFSRSDGYQLEGRPWANGAASYGFDLAQLQRVAACVHYTFGAGLVGKVEVGFDHLVATATSGLRNDTRLFTAAELVLSF